MKASIRAAYHAYFKLHYGYSTGRKMLVADLMREHKTLIDAAERNIRRYINSQNLQICKMERDFCHGNLESSKLFIDISDAVLHADWEQSKEQIGQLIFLTKMRCVRNINGNRAARLERVAVGARLP